MKSDREARATREQNIERCARRVCASFTRAYRASFVPLDAARKKDLQEEFAYAMRALDDSLRPLPERGRAGRSP